MSSCSWGWRRVVCQRQHLGHRGGSWGHSSSWWGPGACSLLLSVPTIIHSPYPTCKQALAAVGVGGRSVLSWISVWGGGWGMSVRCGCLWGLVGAY
ncbi:hypothetical protein L208DRAFT_12738 [Tricholoma matsutake]|nr:hypothetical protein L208DRAFT_12738 [Tricholoma matsutake 945]